MAPSRSRKRASTLKTVELLNNLSHGSGRTLRSRQQRKDDTAPRSDDIWDIMNSPEAGRAVAGARRRSRRSTRIRTEPDMSTGLGDTRKSTEGEGEESDGEEQEGQDEVQDEQEGQEQEEQEQEQEEQEQEEQEQEEEQVQDKEQEDHDHDPDDMLYMFSDDENEARRSRSRWESPQLPSPRALIEQHTTSYGENQDGSRSLLSGSTRHPEVNIEVAGRESSLFVRQDEPIQHDESTHDHDPVFAPESSESSSSESEAESEAESPQLNKRRRVVQEDKDCSRHVRISLHGKDAGAGGVDDKARDLQWMQKAMNLGQQRDNWLVVTSTAKELSRMADDPDGAECDDICALIRGLRSLYGEMDASTKPSSATLAQCDNLFTSVSHEADKLLDRVYYLATDDGPCGRAQDLMAAFDTGVVPGLVRLVIACFRVYYTAPLLFSGLLEHLRRILLLLRGLWVRTTSMKAQRIVHGGGGGGGGAVKHGKAFGQAVHGILQALETGALRSRDLPRNDEDYSQDGREWTRDEGLALIDGLQLYQGSDRYVRIIGRFGHRLRDRTQHDMRQKALQVHDKIRPTLQEEEHGRWRWLLSVRGDEHSSSGYDPS